MSQHPEQDPNLIERSFALYRERIGEAAAAHPQRQGFSEEEFTEALNSPVVIKTNLEIDGEVYQLPQLAPVGSFEWLHEPYFSQHFPEETESGSILHFTDFEGVEPGEEVKHNLLELAAKGGKLVIDYRDNDATYPQRVAEQLEKIGIQVSPEQLLGTQTYFAGQAELKRPHKERDHFLTYPEAFAEKMAAGEVDAAEFTNGTTLETVVTGEEADVLQAFYSDAYATISDHPCTQALNPDEFREMLEDPAVAKIVKRQDGIAQSLCLLTPDLDSLTWINTDYYKKNYPEQYAEGKMLWFPGIATDPNPNVAGANLPKMVGLLADLTEIADVEPVVVFDSPDINTGFLDVYIEDSVSKTPQVNLPLNPIGAQRYSALTLSRNV